VITLPSAYEKNLSIVSQSNKPKKKPKKEAKKETPKESPKKESES
jgi:hypothetical protein|tara:strand:+ start:1368 stop:1502 length:135 start_codon:yes stop_codon:yes gene_type:complete